MVNRDTIIAVSLIIGFVMILVLSIISALYYNDSSNYNATEKVFNYNESEYEQRNITNNSNSSSILSNPVTRRLFLGW